ncbi:MAG: NADH-quinone oxidoreductase subunit G [Campylobacteraceae bacterium]|jgi:NADH-quinone oxidoreductase subunit G|nr:NADH-quinone oxidoreductase subunit G [Campylobacteraceae bacterium]
MADITITINGAKITAKENETILNIARANGIFIPAICYLSCCSPTLACRLCMADVDGKRVYTCNAKAKDGQIVVTNTEEIEAERRAIMEVYTVNHPLECGVCDKSGECELQNYVLETKVKEQHYTVTCGCHKVQDWGNIRYDASLCIVCERCVTVCKDKIGDAALKTVPRGDEFSVPKEYKEIMSKDAYAVWNKMQKSLIDRVRDENGDIIDCVKCGECSAVCPTGALSESGFHYVSNAWELKRIPAANPHSSDCSLIYYEVKHRGIEDTSLKIYRVHGEHNFAPLNTAARYGYDFENKDVVKDEKAKQKLVDFIKNEAGTILFNSFITNEEALILQKLKEKFSLKLVNEDAYVYQRFLKAMGKCSGRTLYKGSLESIRESDFIISVGSMLRYDAPNIGYMVNNALKINRASAIYCHPISDRVVCGFSKNLIELNYKPGSEEAVLYLLLELFAPLSELDDITGEYLQTFHIKEKKNIDNQEIDVITSKFWDIIGLEDKSKQIKEMKTGKSRFTLIIGEDVLTHPRWQNMAYIAGTLEHLANFEIVVIPTQTNTLGVSLICELDKHEDGKTLGYNRLGDMTMSAFGDGFDMPSLNQQEGTFTNIDKRVVPTNAALPYGGYELNDIASELGIYAKYTIDYTQKLPIKSGFKEMAFDDLVTDFDNAGKDKRGYEIVNGNIEISKTPTGYENLTLCGDIVYRLNPISQFSVFTNLTHHLKRKGALFASREFIDLHNLYDGQNVKITSQSGAILYLNIEEDKNITGNFAYLPTFDKTLNIYPFFEEYRFAPFSIEGIYNDE